MKKPRWILRIAVAFGTTVPLFAQMGGNPVGVRGKGAWTLSAEANYLDQYLGSQRMILRRQDFRLTRGLFSWLDGSVLLGRAGLTLGRPSATVSEYRDRYRLMVGLGLSMVLKPETPTSPVQIWAGVQGIRFVSEGTYDLSQGISHGSLVWKKAFTYDWREIQGWGGMSLRLRQTIRLYVGAAGWALQRLETQKEFWNNAWSKPVKGTCQSGLWTGGLAGVEFSLPRQYGIGIEVLAFNRQNYQIRVGICQTGEKVEKERDTWP